MRWNELSVNGKARVIREARERPGSVLVLAGGGGAEAGGGRYRLRGVRWGIERRLAMVREPDGRRHQWLYYCPIILPADVEVWGPGVEMASREG